MDNVTVEVEYCNKCGYLYKFEELKRHVEEQHPTVNVEGRQGRRGSFEVTVNGSVVHSKLQTLAYPDHDDLCHIIKDAQNGKGVRHPCKQQPITSCTIA